MTLLATVSSLTGTCHSLAAACSSMVRAMAPPWRTYRCELRMPRLPPVEKSPHTRLRATLWPGVGYSVVTFDQSHSSSSATSCARPVSVPWPISERAMRMTTVSSGRITTQALTSGEPSWARTTCGPADGKPTLSARPPPATAAAPTTNERRSSCSMAVMAAPSRALSCHMDRLAHLLEGAAATDVGDGIVDVGISGLGFLLQQRRHGHDHAALAVAALRHIVIDPSLLHLVQHGVLGQAFDGGDGLAFHGADRQRARPHGLAVDMHGAGAALGDTAAVFGPGQANVVPDGP